jgi:hypothetical protein
VYGDILKIRRPSEISRFRIAAEAALSASPEHQSFIEPCFDRVEHAARCVSEAMPSLSA